MFVPQHKVLAVTNTAYAMKADTLSMHLEMREKDASFLSNIFPNDNGKISIVSSSVPLSEVKKLESGIEYLSRKAGQQMIRWDASLGKPKVESATDLGSVTIELNQEGSYMIKIVNTLADQLIRITSG